MHLPGFKCTQTPVGLSRRGRVALWAPIGGISALLPKGKGVDKGCVDQTCTRAGRPTRARGGCGAGDSVERVNPTLTSSFTQRREPNPQGPKVLPAGDKPQLPAVRIRGEGDGSGDRKESSLCQLEESRRHRTWGLLRSCRVRGTPDLCPAWVFSFMPSAPRRLLLFSARTGPRCAGPPLYPSACCYVGREPGLPD